MTGPIRGFSEKRVTASIVAVVDPDVTIARALRGRLVREIGRMVKAVALREKLPHLALEVRLMMDASTRELARDHRITDAVDGFVALADAKVLESGHLGTIVISYDIANHLAKQHEQALHTELLVLASRALCALIGTADTRPRADALRREAMRSGHVRPV